MKTTFKLLSIVFFLLLINSCDNDDDEGYSANNLKTGEVELKVDLYADKRASFEIAAANITIDWGDGHVDVLTPNGIRTEYIHEYTKQNSQTIKISTESMTLFSLSYFGDYKELRFGDCFELEKIENCYSRRLTVLDIKKAPALTYLNCSNNRLTLLNVSGCTALTSLICGEENQLRSLDVSKCTVLAYLNCNNNQLSSLNISKCTDLVSLRCGNNQLISLDISKCTVLTHLSCDGNKLSSLDVSKCTDLASLACGNNKLTSLDVSKCTDLASLACGNNKLTSLDVSKCTDLALLWCYNNQLKAIALNNLFNTLGTTSSGWLDIANNPGTSTCDKSIAENKGWSITSVPLF